MERMSIECRNDVSVRKTRPLSPLISVTRVTKKKTTAVVNFKKKLIKADCLVWNGYKTLVGAISVLLD